MERIEIRVTGRMDRRREARLCIKLGYRFEALWLEFKREGRL